MSKALIIYGSHYGATANTGEEIASTLQKEGLQVNVVNAKEEKVTDISTYDLVIVGSGIEIGKWRKETEVFLKRFQKDLANKKLAFFVSCGASSVALNDGKPEEMAKNKEAYLNKEADKFGLKPMAFGFFGGIYDYNRMSWFVKFILGRRSITSKLKSAFKEVKPGIYDTRDMAEIRAWAEDLATKIKK
jgi:menaquinone-dependent protoporphyrinogen oxidase